MAQRGDEDLQIRTRLLVGRATQAGGPVKAALGFTGKESPFPFSASSGEQGDFKVEVPEDRAWKVRVKMEDAPLITLQDPFPPPRPPAPPVYPAVYAPPEVRIPDTRLPVVVVDQHRRPVPGAWVIVPGNPENRFRTDASGFCEIRGLKPGSQCPLAEHPSRLWKGETATVELHEGIKEPLFCLVLPEMIEICGRIEPRFGTAPDALVVARPPGTGPAVSTRTDGDGEFRIALPAGTRNAELWVLAPGAAFRKLRVEVDPRKVLQVPVEPAGGTLVLEMPDAVLRQARESNALDSDLALLCHWAYLQGCAPEPGRLVVPNVEPGAYTLADGVPLTLEHGEPAAEDPRPHGVLAAEGELTLRLPAMD